MCSRTSAALEFVLLAFLFNFLENFISVVKIGFDGLGENLFLPLKNVFTPRALKFLMAVLIIWRKLGACKLCFGLQRTEGSTCERQMFPSACGSTVTTLIYNQLSSLIRKVQCVEESPPAYSECSARSNYFKYILMSQWKF